jgi:hypothetical protein
MNTSNTRSSSNRFRSLIAVAALALASAAACSSPTPPSLPASSGVEVDQVESVKGIPDPSDQDPAVLALEIAGAELCTGTLVAPDVVLTARHCVSVTVSIVTCPSSQPQVLGERPASTIRVLAGSEVSSSKEVARGKQIFVPASDSLCDADIALVLLDKAVKNVEPLDVSTAGVAPGAFVDSIGYGRPDDGGAAGTKLVRDHVEIIEATTTEFEVGEATCQGDSGGPALDETTGEVLGVVSRGGSSCAGPGARNVYTRTDAFAALIAEAIAVGEAALPGSTDGGKPKKPAKDGGAVSTHDPLGGPCSTGADCATGVCVDDHGNSYCSRTCGSTDHCPAHFKCTSATKSSIDAGALPKVCLEH